MRASKAIGGLFRVGLVLAGAVLLAGCLPMFNANARVETAKQVLGFPPRIIWPRAFDPDDGDVITSYEISINGGAAKINLPATQTFCSFEGLQQGVYQLTITAYGRRGADGVVEWSGNLGGTRGQLTSDLTVPPVTTYREPRCVDYDQDTDGLPDWAESGTGRYVSLTDTGTSRTDKDTDDDGLLDGDEVLGSLGGVDLPAMKASPVKKDIAVEFDWFSDASGCASHSHQPTRATIDALTAGFAAVPVSNPDLTTGIHLIADYGQSEVFHQGQSLGSLDNLQVDVIPSDGISGTNFYALKAANFKPNRKGIFHYAVNLHQFNGLSDTYGNGEIGGDDLILANHCRGNDLSGVQAAALAMHELGHNLGLRHGGPSDLDAKSPNYNSVMNYRYVLGVDRNCDARGDLVPAYSSGTRPPLDENAVIESNGVCQGGPGIDWNGSGTITSDPFAYDLNGDAARRILRDHDDAALLSLPFASSDSDGASAEPLEWAVELSSGS